MTETRELKKRQGWLGRVLDPPGHPSALKREAESRERAGAAAIQAAIEATRTPIADSERRAVLERVIAENTARGWRVTSRDDYTAQLLKPKEFSALAAFMFFLLLGIGLLIYLFIYAAERDTLAFCSVDEFGRVVWTTG